MQKKRKTQSRENKKIDEEENADKGKEEKPYEKKADGQNVKTEKNIKKTK